MGWGVLSGNLKCHFRFTKNAVEDTEEEVWESRDMRWSNFQSQYVRECSWIHITAPTAGKSKWKISDLGNIRENWEPPFGQVFSVRSFPAVLRLGIHCDFERGGSEVKCSSTLQVAFCTHVVSQGRSFFLCACGGGHQSACGSGMESLSHVCADRTFKEEELSLMSAVHCPVKISSPYFCKNSREVRISRTQGFLCSGSPRAFWPFVNRYCVYLLLELSSLM